MTKKLTAFLAAGLFVSALFTGCGGSAIASQGTGGEETSAASGIEALQKKMGEEVQTIEDKLEDARQVGGSEAEKLEKALESEMEALKKRLEETRTGEIIDAAIEEAKADVGKIEEMIAVQGKAALEFIKEDERTLKYRFTLIGDAALELREIDDKVALLAEEIGARLQTLKNKGVAEPVILVQFVEKEGAELYLAFFA